MYNYHDYSETCEKSLVRSTKNNPCPHCGKTDWCYSIGELSVCKRSHEPAPGWEKTSKCDSEGSFYYAPAKPEPWVKPPRPIKTTHYLYPDRLGNPLVRVTRKDTGNGEKSIYQEHYNGKQWIKGLGEVKRENIPIYRYQEINQAIKNGETIFVVEGEGKADLLWSLGLPATCNIAGSGKWRPSDTQDLNGAAVILCPDRDKPGIKHMESIFQDFPNANWLYPFPDSPLWHHLPDSKGADLKDWVDEGASKEDIIKAIGEKKTLTPQKTEKPANVVSHPKFTPKPLEIDQLEGTIDILIKENVAGSKREIKLSSIAREYGLSQQQITNIYKERIKELERSEGYEDAIEELEKLAIADHARVNLLEILPEKLANGINHHARLTGLRGEAYLTALLSGLSSTLHPDTALSLYPQTDWKVPPNLYCAIVALSGEGKSIIGRAMISDPLKALIEGDDSDYESKLSEYKASLANYEMLKKSKNSEALSEAYPDGPPSKPTRRIRYFSGGTGEGIARYAANSQDKGMLLFRDEIAGLFKSANQYRGGRGSDSEDILEYYDGTPPITLRADPDKTVVCRKILLSIYGTIQPGVLEKLLGDKEDSSGQWSRFLFCQLPPSTVDLDIDAGTVVLSPMLTDLYRQFDRLPVATYDLSRPARVRFLQAANRLKSLSDGEQRPAMRNVLIKARGLIGRLALNLHLLNSLFEGITPSIEIGVKTIENAIELADFYVSQVQGMYVRLSDDLPSHYARLLSVAGDWITPNNARKVAFSGKTKAEYPSSRIAEVFKELSDKGYGETRLTTRGSIEFRALKGDNLIPPAKPLPDKDSEIKGDKGGIKGDNLIPPTEPLPSKDYSLKGDKGDKKNHFTSENLSPLTDISDKELSPLTEKSKRDNTLSPLSPLSPQDSETQSQQDFTRGDKLKSPLSPLSPLSPQDGETDSDHPVGDTDNLKPDDYCFFKGRCHTVISVDGDKITVKDWYEKDNPSCLPFTVSIDEVVIDTPGPKREKKKKAK
jgi:CRISPR-associated protein Cmr3